MAKKRNTRDYNKNYPCFAEGGADDYNTDLGDDEPNFQKWKFENRAERQWCRLRPRGAYKAG